MITIDELRRYLLILREEEMNNNYKLSDTQINLISKVNKALKEDPSLKTKLDNLLCSKSIYEMNFIEEGVDPIKLEKNIKFEERNESSGVENVVQLEDSKQYVLKNQRRAGYVDALIMALVTGFIGGVFTTIILMICK